MSIVAAFALHVLDARARWAALEERMARRRIVAERKAGLWRLYAEVLERL